MTSVPVALATVYAVEEAPKCGYPAARRIEHCGKHGERVDDSSASRSPPAVDFFQGAAFGFWNQPPYKKECGDRNCGI